MYAQLHDFHMFFKCSVSKRSNAPMLLAWYLRRSHISQHYIALLFQIRLALNSEIFKAIIRSWTRGRSNAYRPHKAPFGLAITDYGFSSSLTRKRGWVHHAVARVLKKRRFSLPLTGDDDETSEREWRVQDAKQKQRLHSSFGC